MWTQETEFKSLSGRKPEPASNIQPGFGEPLKWYEEDVYKAKEGEKFVLTNVTIANNGKKASLLMTVGKVQEKSQWGKRSPLLDNSPAFSIKNSGTQTVTGKNGTTFSVIDQPMFGQGGDIFYNWDMEFVDASDNKTPVDVTVQNGWADIEEVGFRYSIEQFERERLQKMHKMKLMKKTLYKKVMWQLLLLFKKILYGAVKQEKLILII